MDNLINAIIILSQGDIPESGNFLGDTLKALLADYNLWPNQIDSIEDIIQMAVTLGTTFAGLVALYFLIRHGGYEYITSAGNPEQSKKAVQAITQSVIGLVLVLVAYLIISYVLKIVGG